MFFGMCCDCRIPVCQIGRDQSCLRFVCVSCIPRFCTEIRCLYGITTACYHIIEINHLDADAELVVVYCLYGRRRIRFFNRRRYYRKMEIGGFIERAGNYP